MSVLIIDNDPIFLMDLQKAFEKQGYQVITTTDSLSVKKLVCQYAPHAVILNIFMQDKDGFELINEIRAYCRKTFILAISHHEFYLKIIRQLGANASLLKTTQPNLIVHKLQSVLF